MFDSLSMVELSAISLKKHAAIRYTMRALFAAESLQKMRHHMNDRNRASSDSVRPLSVSRFEVVASNGEAKSYCGNLIANSIMVIAILFTRL